MLIERNWAQNVMKKFPQGGMALHGTSFENALRINESGLNRGNNYHNPLPGPLMWSRGEKPGKFALKAYGSALWSSFYAAEKRSRGDMAIVIFASWNKDDWMFLGGYGAEESSICYTYGPGGKKLVYPSFGKEYGSGFPAQYVARILKFGGESVEASEKAASELLPKLPIKEMMFTSTDELSKRLLMSEMAGKVLAAISDICRHGRI